MNNQPIDKDKTSEKSESLPDTWRAAVVGVEASAGDCVSAGSIVSAYPGIW